ncbi:hypothetical protein C8Q76DRAFT_718146, partial [Earliella scabrosa]
MNEADGLRENGTTRHTNLQSVSFHNMTSSRSPTPPALSLDVQLLRTTARISSDRLVQAL